MSKFTSEDVAQQKLRDYRAQIEQAGGTITLVMLGMETSSVRLRISVTGQEQSTKAMTTQRGPALFVTLPEGVDIYTLLPDAKGLAFLRVP